MRFLIQILKTNLTSRGVLRRSDLLPSTNARRLLLRQPADRNDSFFAFGYE